MIGSLFAGISGLNANAKAMTVIGDNIANVNTTAFKSNRSSFANVLSQSLGGATGDDIGRGVEFWGTSPMWTQGSLENTGNATDLAINGKGFFIVNDSSATSFFTRAGLFTLNELGDLVNPDDLIVQGYAIDPQTGSLGNIGDISFPGERVSPPTPTTTFTFDINLDGGAVVDDEFSSSQLVYDTLGNAIPLILTFTKLADDLGAVPPVIRAWEVTGTADDIAVGFTPATGARFVFDNEGNLEVPTGLSSALTYLTLDANMTNGAADLDLHWDLLDSNGDVLEDISGYAAASATTFQYQDGSASGMLRGISVDESGIVTATYSNGQLSPEFQVAMADFASYEGLSKLGKNLYSESLNSGQPLHGIAGNGRLGTITPMAVEMSNVDLAQEFVKMITTQRAFQANSRVITTSDEILNELINLKR